MTSYEAVIVYFQRHILLTEASKEQTIKRLEATELIASKG